MKAYQIISERKQLNELVPLIAGLTVAGVLQALSVAMTAWSIYDLYKFTSKWSDDPAKLTQSDWNSAFLDAVLLAVPAVGRLGKAALIKVLPESVIAKGGVWMQTKVMDLIAKKGSAQAVGKGADELIKPALKQGPNGWFWQLPGGQKITQGKGFADQAAAIKWAKTNPEMFKPAVKTAGKAAGAEIKVGKEAMTVTKAAEEAGKKKFLGLSPLIQDVLKWGVTAEFAANYYMQIAELEDQYQKCIAGNKTTKIFGDDTKEAAYAHANQIRTQLIGEAVLGVGLSMGVASKAVGLIGSLGKFLTTGITGSATVGRAVGALPNLGARLLKLVEGGPLRSAAALAFLQTPYGKKFLENSVVELITGTVGGITAATVDLGIEAVEAAGVAVPNAAKTKITDPRSPENQTAAADQVTNVQRDPANTKVVYINGVQISDENGFQAVGDKMMNDIRADAQALGKPDPTASIKKDPNKKYDYYGIN